MNIQRFCIQNKYLSPFCCHKPQIINKLSQTYDLSLYGNFFDNLHLFKFDQSNEALDSCNYKGILVCESDMFDTWNDHPFSRAYPHFFSFLDAYFTDVPIFRTQIAKFVIGVKNNHTKFSNFVSLGCSLENPLILYLHQHESICKEKG